MYFSIYFPGRSFSRVILNQKNPKVCKYQLFEIDYLFQSDENEQEQQSDTEEGSNKKETQVKPLFFGF